MDFNPLEIKRMMEQRQQELRGKKSAAPEEITSPTKRIRHEKENAHQDSPMPPVQGFMAKFAVSPKSVRKDGALSQASPSAKTRLNELSKKYAEMEDEVTSSPSKSKDTATTPRKRAPAAPTTPKSSKKKAPSPPEKAAKPADAKSSGTPVKKWEVTERTTVTIHRTTEKTRETVTGKKSTEAKDPSLAKVSEKAKSFEKTSESTRVVLPPMTKVLPSGKVSEKISKFDVGASGPRCVIETKPLGSVSSRAKFFEKAMADDKKAADAVYIPVSQRATKDFEREERANEARHQYRPVKPVVCDTVIEKTEERDEPQPEQGTHESDDDEVEPVQVPVEQNPQSPEDPMEEDTVQPNSDGGKDDEEEKQTPVKKVGQVSNKLKNRLEDMIVNGHQTPEETLLSISEKSEEPKASCSTVMEEEEEQSFNDEDFLLSPHLRAQRQRVFADDTISRITGIPEDGHSTPKLRFSSEESLGTPLQKTMSQYRKDEKEAQKRDPDVKRIVYEVPSDMITELRKGKDPQPAVQESAESLEAYRKKFEEELVKQESIMKQTSHALIVCQDNGDQGSEQQVEAERLLLIATQRHHVVQSELQRINLQKTVPQSNGTLSICDIQLPFKNEFLKLMRHCNEVLDYSHYFIVLVRSGASLIHTEMVSTNERISGGCVSLGHHMVLKNLQEGFRAFVEVYAVQALNRNHPEYETTLKKLRREKEKESNKGGILSAFTPSKKKHGTPHTGSGSDDVKIRKPSFGLIGRVTLDENLIAIDKQVHYLDSYFHDSPLDGRILMKIQLNMPPKVSHCGMLRLKDTNGIFGGVDFIKSFFAAIEGSHLNLWNDIREAEEEQEPLKSYDLSQSVGQVRVGRSFNFYYFPLKLSDKTEMNFLTYAEEESTLWAEKLNACIERCKKKF